MLIIDKLIWDEWNIAHIARHQVTPQEVEEACQSDHVLLQSYASRLILIGITKDQRMVTVVLDPEGEDTYFVVTARSASRKERRYYQEQKGGEGDD